MAHTHIQRTYFESVVVGHFFSQGSDPVIASIYSQSRNQLHQFLIATSMVPVSEIPGQATRSSFEIKVQGSNSLHHLCAQQGNAAKVSSLINKSKPLSPVMMCS